jgi:hypothetical protein
VHDSARAADRRCPDCRCGKVAVIAGLDTRPDSFSLSQWNIFRSDHSFAGISGSRHAYRGQQRGCKKLTTHLTLRN